MRTFSAGKGSSTVASRVTPADAGDAAAPSWPRARLRKYPNPAHPKADGILRTGDELRGWNGASYAICEAVGRA